MSTAWDNFQGATLSLARSGTIKDRLTDAYRNHLAAVTEDELPRRDPRTVPQRPLFAHARATATRRGCHSRDGAQDVQP